MQTYRFIQNEEANLKGKFNKIYYQKWFNKKSLIGRNCSLIMCLLDAWVDPGNSETGCYSSWHSNSKGGAGGGYVSPRKFLNFKKNLDFLRFYFLYSGSTCDKRVKTSNDKFKISQTNDGGATPSVPLAPFSLP